MSTTTTTTEQLVDDREGWERAEDELALTQSSRANDEQTLLVHRLTCRLRAPRTPLALVSTDTLLGHNLRPCTTCQPSKRQQHELGEYVQRRRDEQQHRSMRETHRADACMDDECDVHELVELGVAATSAVRKSSDELDAFLSTPAARRVIELAADADVVPLTKRGKRNVRRNARHDQRTAARELVAPMDESGATKRCSDCEQDVKLTSFPTSTSNGQRVRLDYCRKCRTARQTAKAAQR
jgi:hypothetical protein